MTLAASRSYDHASEIRNDIHVVSTNWFVNRCPLVSRVPRVPVGSTTFAMLARTNRGRVEPPETSMQFCQTWQHPVWPSAYSPQPLERQPFDTKKMEALQNLMDDMETTSFYGIGVDPAVSGRPKQKGIRTLLSTNNITAPDHASNYTASDFVRDTLERCRSSGGDPDVVLLSTNFMAAFSVWGQPVHRLNAGTTVFGAPIDIFETPMLGGVSIIEAPLLRPFTAVCLTSCEVRLRMKRNEFWNPRGSRGDVAEGDWIAEGAIEVENERHHAWLEGVRAFAGYRQEPAIDPA